VTLDELSDEASAAIGRVLPPLCRAVKKVTGCTGYNILQNNGSIAHQVVMHVHFHIIPKNDEATGLGIAWPAKNIDHEDGKNLAEALRTATAAP
jgi:diadenosine tetraphosphate (Ap4A) HIT family hydrolase